MHTILILDQQPVARLGARAVLSEGLDQATVLEAADGSAALALLRARSVDLLIVEPDFSEGDGMRFIHTLRKQWPGTMVLTFSALPRAAFGERLVRAGSAGFIHKEAPLEELVTEVQSLLSTPCSERTPAPPDRRSSGPSVAREQRRDALLSDRELQVLRLLALGYSAPKAGGILAISAKTINTHRRHIYRKLEISTPTELSRFAFQHGLVRSRRVSDQD